MGTEATVSLGGRGGDGRDWALSALCSCPLNTGRCAGPGSLGSLGEEASAAGSVRNQGGARVGGSGPQLRQTLGPSLQLEVVRRKLTHSPKTSLTFQNEQLRELLLWTPLVESKGSAGAEGHWVLTSLRPGGAGFACFQKKLPPQCSRQKRQPRSWRARVWTDGFPGGTVRKPQLWGLGRGSVCAATNQLVGLETSC